MKVTAVVLAAGLSCRMGENKLLLPVLGRPMLMHSISLVSQLDVSQRILVTNPETAREIGENAWISDDEMKCEYTRKNGNIENEHTQNKWEIILNTEAEKGQSESVKLAVKAAKPENSLLFFMGDQPFLDRQTVENILAFNDGMHMVNPVDEQGQVASPSLIPPRFREELLALTGDTGGRFLRQKYPQYVKTVAVSQGALLFDIDTKEAYEKIKRI